MDDIFYRSSSSKAKVHSEEEAFELRKLNYFIDGLKTKMGKLAIENRGLFVGKALEAIVADSKNKDELNAAIKQLRIYENGSDKKLVVDYLPRKYLPNPNRMPYVPKKL